MGISRTSWALASGDTSVAPTNRLDFWFRLTHLELLLRLCGENYMLYTDPALFECDCLGAGIEMIDSNNNDVIL